MTAREEGAERRLELLRSDSFTVEVEGRSLAGFSSCRGLESSRSVLVYREGGATRATCLPEASDPVVLVLERGLSGDRSLWDWYESGEAREGAITLLGPDGRERARWRFRSAVPTRWRGADLDAAHGQVALEELELVCEKIEWSVTRDAATPKLAASGETGE